MAKFVFCYLCLSKVTQFQILSLELYEKMINEDVDVSDEGGDAYNILIKTNDYIETMKFRCQNGVKVMKL